MRKSKYSEEQIIGILREAEGETPVKVVCARHNISEPTFYKWRSKYGGMDDDEARRPAEAVVRSARVLLVDRFGLPGMIRAARMARAADIPVVGDFESSGMARFGELLALVDHLIVSREFAVRLTGARTPVGAVRKLWSKSRAVVVVTAGPEGC